MSVSPMLTGALCSPRTGVDAPTTSTAKVIAAAPEYKVRLMLISMFLHCLRLISGCYDRSRCVHPFFVSVVANFLLQVFLSADAPAPVVYLLLRPVYFGAAPPSPCKVAQLRMLGKTIGGNLGDQLVEDGLPERLEVLGHQHEGAGAAGHVVAIIVVQPSRRVGVIGIPRHRALAQNDEAVDGHALLERLVAGVGDVAAGIVGAVAGNVDGVAVGVERCAGELSHREVDAAADRGAVGEGARRLDDLGG